MAAAPTVGGCRLFGGFRPLTIAAVPRPPPRSGDRASNPARGGHRSPPPGKSGSGESLGGWCGERSLPPRLEERCHLAGERGRRFPSEKEGERGKAAGGEKDGAEAAANAEVDSPR